MARGAKIDLEKVAKEQQIKNQQEMEKILAAIKSKIGAERLREEGSFITNGRDGKRNGVSGRGANIEAVKDKHESAIASVLCEQAGSKDGRKIKKSRKGRKKSKLDVTDNPEDNKHTGAEEEEEQSDKLSGKVFIPHAFQLAALL